MIIGHRRLDFKAGATVMLAVLPSASCPHQELKKNFCRTNACTDRCCAGNRYDTSLATNSLLSAHRVLRASCVFSHLMCIFTFHPLRRPLSIPSYRQNPNRFATCPPAKGAARILSQGTWVLSRALEAHGAARALGPGRARDARCDLHCTQRRRRTPRQTLAVLGGEGRWPES